MNEFCNDYGILNRNRNKLFIKEMEYISLYIHNVSPLNNNEQGIYPDDKSISKHTIFFNKYDPLPIACKKWHGYISEDYNFFWDAFSQKVNYCTLSYIKIIEPQDIYEIVYFINPAQSICAILEHLGSCQIVNFIYQKF